MWNWKTMGRENTTRGKKITWNKLCYETVSIVKICYDRRKGTALSDLFRVLQWVLFFAIWNDITRKHHTVAKCCNKLQGMLGESHTASAVCKVTFAVEMVAISSYHWKQDVTSQQCPPPPSYSRKRCIFTKQRSRGTLRSRSVNSAHRTGGLADLSQARLRCGTAPRATAGQRGVRQHAAARGGVRPCPPQPPAQPAPRRCRCSALPTLRPRPDAHPEAQVEDEQQDLDAAHPRVRRPHSGRSSGGGGSAPQAARPDSAAPPRGGQRGGAGRGGRCRAQRCPLPAGRVRPRAAVGWSPRIAVSINAVCPHAHQPRTLQAHVPLAHTSTLLLKIQPEMPAVPQPWAPPSLTFFLQLRKSLWGCLQPSDVRHSLLRSAVSMLGISSQCSTNKAVISCFVLYRSNGRAVPIHCCVSESVSPKVCMETVQKKHRKDAWVLLFKCNHTNLGSSHPKGHWGWFLFLPTLFSAAIKKPARFGLGLFVCLFKPPQMVYFHRNCWSLWSYFFWWNAPFMMELLH